MRLENPRLVNHDFIVSIGSQTEFSSNLDLAIQQANSDMINWLTGEYKLTPPEAHLLMGMVVQHKIITYFGSVTTMIPRKYLPR
jgi:acetamidase/formamidase